VVNQWELIPLAKQLVHKVLTVNKKHAA